jgi:hypothetical protein
MTGKGFRFGSRTEEVNRKVMEERSDDYNPGNNSDYDKNNSGHAQNQNGYGMLVVYGRDLYAWKPGKRLIRILGKRMGTIYGIGNLGLCDDQVYHINHEGVFNLFDGSRIGEGEHYGRLYTHDGELYYTHGSDIIEASSGSNVFKHGLKTDRSSVPYCVHGMTTHKGEFLCTSEKGIFNVFSGKKLMGSDEFQDLISFDGDLFYSCYSNIFKTPDNTISVNVATNRGRVFMCAHKGVLYDGSNNRIYQTISDPAGATPIITFPEDPREPLTIRSMISVPEKIFKTVLDIKDSDSWVNNYG